MARIITINVALTDADEAAYMAHSFADRQAFVIAKLAAILESSLQESLSNGKVLASMSPADQQKIGAAKAAPIKAAPMPGGEA
jgi:hypothetical protein